MDLQAVDTVLVDSLWRVVQMIFAGADIKAEERSRRDPEK
jgi:hypothetical protein